MVKTIKRANNDIFGWPLLGIIFRHKRVLFVVRFLVMALFLSALYFGLTYPSVEENPYTTTIFWSLFWPFFMILSLVLIGPAFCGICPHGVMGRYLHKFSLKKKIPSWLANRGIGLSMLIMAYWIPVYLFPELFRSPFASALLFLLLTLFAAGAYLLFKDMAYCTYLCPIGAVTKVYGKVGMTELRTYQEACSECKTFECATACETNLQPFLFEKKNSMRDCTLCMDCANACEAVSFSIVKPGSTLIKKINDKEKSHIWVIVLLLAIITVTMKLHHGLGHSPMKESLPWYKLGKWMETFMPTGVDWVGFNALVISLVITAILVFGGFYIAAKIVKVEYKTYLSSLSYALIPLMVVGALSHVGTFFFVSYESHFINAYYWLIGSDIRVKPIATFRDGWVHLFALFNYVAIIWSEILVYKRVAMFSNSIKERAVAILFSSLMALFLLALAFIGR